MTHVLLDLSMDLDNALREALPRISSPRCAQRIRDAAAAVREELLALTIGHEGRRITIHDVRAVLVAARRDQVPWLDIADVVRELQGE
jgi:hypothetical protein